MIFIEQIFNYCSVQYVYNLHEESVTSLHACISNRFSDIVRLQRQQAADSAFTIAILIKHHEVLKNVSRRQ